MRSIWKGHIRFLLVAIPVRIYNAIETSEKIQFNQLHREDFGPIGYDKRCKKCSQVVSNDQITKGYQYEPDRYAIVEPDDIAKIRSRPPGPWILSALSIVTRSRARFTMRRTSLGRMARFPKNLMRCCAR
jgi:hypothetical protein